MAEQSILGNSALHYGLECPNVVNAFSDVGSLREEILIHVRYHVGIRIKAGLAREES
jgi:hypothetical protein